MKKYNVQNYVRYKKDLEECLKKISIKDWQDYNRNELIIKFMPLVENLARKFSTSQQGSGCMCINDLIQVGNAGLTHAVDRIDKERLLESDDPEKTIKSFLAKRIKGAIRRGIDINRGDMRIPEHKLNEIRRNFGKDKKMVAMFFNSIFLSIDAKTDSNNNLFLEIEDKEQSYNKELLSTYLISLLKQHLNIKEYEVLKLSYGLNCDKKSAKEIAKKLGIEGSGAYVRVSQLKKQAINKLIENVDHSQVIDFL